MFHREEIKKINRDKAQLSERLKEAEGAQLRLDGEVHSLKAAAAVSGERHDASTAQLEKRLQRAQEAVQAKQDEVRTIPHLPWRHHVNHPPLHLLVYTAVV